MRGIKMTKELPLPIQTYVSAMNRHDIDGMLRPFLKEATVLDEGQTYHGHVDIRKWMEETTRKYRVTGEVSGVTGTDAARRVSILISGDFPGSPIELAYSFALEGDLISRLEITV
jgi:SnoaL-like domain